MSTYLLVIIGLALLFDYINGFHDAANSIATVVSTKVLSPFQAVLWAAFFNVVAYFIFTDHAVANTIGKTVFSDYITLPVIFSGLMAAIIWNLLTWWFGIPSSSSHTLIGGFAGAALCAAWMKDPSLDIHQIIDSAKIWKIFAFIFLAPFIGMAISMFYSFVLIHRNPWWKISVLAATAVVLWVLFAHFQDTKMKENVAKFLRINKNERIIEEAKLQIGHEKSQAKIALLEDKIKAAEIKLAKGEQSLKTLEPIIEEYPTKGAAWVAQQLAKDSAIHYAVIARLSDKISAFYKINQLEVLAHKDTQYLAKYQAAKLMVDSLKPWTALYYQVGFDSMINFMVKKKNMNPHESLTFKEKMTIDVEKDLIKELDKANNLTLRYFLVGGILIFIICFYYVDIRKEPSAGRSATLFKRLQLLSSAGFSIGHGGNDAQKVMGIIAASLVADGQFNDIGSAMTVWWIPIACYAAIGLGTLSGGWKIVKTMGNKITKVTPLEGVAAETAGATTLFLTEQMGIPVSTTHTITGSIIGAGATKRLSAVRWGVTINLLWAWILTIPVSALMAALVYFLVQLWS